MKAIGIILVAIAISACQSAPPKQVVEVPKFIKYECGTPPAIEPFVPVEVQWHLITGPDGEVVFSLTAMEYEALSKDISSILSSTKQLALQRDFYRSCINRSGEEE